LQDDLLNFSEPRANVRANGEVELGEEVGCDGSTKKPIHVITHAHADHMGGLTTGGRLVATPETLDLLAALGKLKHKNPLGLAYEKPLQLKDGTLTLFKANHILGAAQVMVETKEGSMAFTGDFKFNGTRVLHPDELVIEATYGRPEQRRNYTDVDLLLVDLVETALQKGPVEVMASNGKLQEVLALLAQLPRGIPIIVDSKGYAIARVYEKYGVRLPEYLEASTERALRAVRDKAYVALWPLNARHTSRTTTVLVTGRSMKPFERLKDNLYLVGLSDHSDFDDLVLYVHESHPRIVITDAYRSPSAPILAKELQERLGIRALARPQVGSGNMG